MRMALVIEPELIVEPDRIHHQRLAVPMPDRMAVPRRNRILGMLAPIHENLPPAMDVSLVHDEVDPGRLRESATDTASRAEFPKADNSTPDRPSTGASSPALPPTAASPRNRPASGRADRNVRVIAAAAQPDSGEIRRAVRQHRRGTGRRRRLSLIQPDISAPAPCGWRLEASAPASAHRRQTRPAPRQHLLTGRHKRTGNPACAHRRTRWFARCRSSNCLWPASR